ncbi:unnamed protein product [Cunninghamella echinulata]
MKSKILLVLLVSIATLVKSAEESSNIQRSTFIDIKNDDITNPSIYPSISSPILVHKRASEGEKEEKEKEKEKDDDENKKKKKIKNNEGEVEDKDKKEKNIKDKEDQEKKKSKNEDEVKHKIVYLTPPSSEIHQARVANNHNKNNYNPDSISPGKADDDQQQQQQRQIPPPQLVDNNDRNNQENKDSQENTNELNKQLNDSNYNGPQGIGKIGTALLSVGGILMVACIAGGILVWKTYQHHRLPFSRQQPPSLSHQDEKFFETSGGIPPPPPAAATTGSMMINRPKSKQSSIVDIESITSNHHHQQYNPSINIDSDLHLSQSQASYMMNWQNELNFNYSMEKLFKNTRESKLTHSQSESNIPQDCKIKIDLIHKDI